MVASALMGLVEEVATPRIVALEDSMNNPVQKSRCLGESVHGPSCTDASQQGPSRAWEWLSGESYSMGITRVEKAAMVEGRVMLFGDQCSAEEGFLCFEPCGRYFGRDLRLISQSSGAANHKLKSWGRLGENSLLDPLSKGASAIRRVSSVCRIEQREPLVSFLSSSGYWGS